MNRRGTWKYIPDRYQAMVATIVSALLYMNIFELLFKYSYSARARFLELVATFAALAICGVVLRRAIKRENATKAN